MGCGAPSHWENPMLANIDHLTRRMDELGVDGLVATTYESIYYFTGIGVSLLRCFRTAANAMRCDL